MFNYYTPRFPFAQGASAGPYTQFVGRRQHVQCVVMPVEHRGRVASPGHVARIPVTQSLWAGRTAPNHRIACRPCRHRRNQLGALGDGAAGLPSGSSLVYNATWHETLNIGPSSSSVRANITPQLAAQGIVVDSYSDVGWLQAGNGFRLNVHTIADFNQPSDVKSIIDHWIYQMVGTMPGSSIATAAMAAPQDTPGSGTNATQIQQWTQNYNDALSAGDSQTAAYWLSLIQGGVAPFSLGSFLSNNWMWLAGGALGLVVLKEIA